MEKYVEELFQQMHDLMHRIIGYLDAKADTRPNLRFVEDDDTKVLLFPVKEKNVIKGGDEKENADVGTSAEEQAFVIFTEKEINQMPKTLRKIILIQKKRCRIRKHVSGKNSVTYEIRYRADGYNVSACGKTIELAKQKFIERFKTAKPRTSDGKEIVPTTFTSFTTYYFEKFRKEKVAPRTYKNDMQRIQKYLAPHFGEKEIAKIIPADCKALYVSIQKSGLQKTANEIFFLMSNIFKAAITHRIIQWSPLDLVLHTPYESEHGIALSRQEEQTLFENLTEPEYVIAAALALYCGLRPNELETAKIDGEFIVAINSKRKNKKVEYKRIPICKKLRPYLKNGIPALPTPQLLRRRIKAAVPGHKLYDLRTTFYTRCQELGVEDVARDYFVGHSLGRLGNTYTDLSVTYLLKEGKKLDLW